jgi:hypothetical protein
VIVFHDGTEYILADGFHRVMGANSAGLVDVLADVRKGSRVDALKYALSANSNHGLKRTNADKRNAIHVALKEFVKLSNSELAKLCSVDDHTVADVRKSMESTSEIPRLETRIGRDGKERKSPTPPPIEPAKKLSLPPTVKPEQKKSPPVSAQVLDKTGWPIPQKLVPIWERAFEVQELLTSMSKIKGALRGAQQDKDILFVEVNFASALAQMDQAYADVKTALPFAVCPTCQGNTPDVCQLCKGRGFISEHRWSTVVPAETKAMRQKVKG